MAGRKKRAVDEVKVNGNRKELANKKFAEVIRAHDEAAFALRSLSRAVAHLRAILPGDCDVVNGRIARLVDPSARPQSVPAPSAIVPVKRKRGRPRKTERVNFNTTAPKDGQTKNEAPMSVMQSDVAMTTQLLTPSQQDLYARPVSVETNVASQSASAAKPKKTPTVKATTLNASRKKFSGPQRRSVPRRACVTDGKSLSPLARGPSGGRGDGHRGRGMRFVRMPNAIEVTLLNRFRVYYDHRRRVDPKVGQRTVADELRELSKGGVYFYQEVIVQMLRGKAVLQVRYPRGKRAIKQWIEQEQQRHGELGTKRLGTSRYVDHDTEESVYQPKNEKKRKRK